MVLSFVIHHKSFAQVQTLDLDSGWHTQSTVLANDEGKTVSSRAFATKDWHPTQPGWTILNTLIKSGVYPDYLPEGVYFMKLRLTDADDALVSDNFYWIPTEEKLTGLEKLPAITLKHTETFRVEGAETVGTVTITNPTAHLAFFVRAILQKGKEEVLPVFWSDNYFSLLPGETKTLEVRVSTEQLAGQKPVVRLEGWNLK